MPVDAHEPTGARILVVDDQEPNVRLLERLLQHAGYTNVVSTTEPEEVATLYLAQPPDLIVLDLMMPKMDGFAVMQDLAKRIPPGTARLRGRSGRSRARRPHRTGLSGSPERWPPPAPGSRRR